MLWNAQGLRITVCVIKFIRQYVWLFVIPGYFAVQGHSTANLVCITVIFFCLSCNVISDGWVIWERVSQLLNRLIARRGGPLWDKLGPLRSLAWDSRHSTLISRWCYNFMLQFQELHCRHIFSLCIVKYPLLGFGAIASDEEFLSTHFPTLLNGVFSWLFVCGTTVFLGSLTIVKQYISSIFAIYVQLETDPDKQSSFCSTDWLKYPL